MIKRLELRNFKKFPNSNINFEVKGTTILVGANNSGKSSILHAMAIWEFGKTYLLFERGIEALLQNYNRQGVGVGLEDFSPISVPSLKYLWTNLKAIPGYTLTLKCIWDTPNKSDCFLEIGLSLNLDRLFIKNVSSNLAANDEIPNIAYLPPFAGISSRETWYSEADRRRLIGSGLTGAVLRNLIIDMFLENRKLREELKSPAGRLSSENLTIIRESDPFEQLNQTLFGVFSVNLIPQNFNPSFHNYIKVDLAKGVMNGRRFVKHTGYNKRDIMVEGSGFLQWLSVYAYALSPSINVLLLDEPDAHLHCSLQVNLLSHLQGLATRLSKQVVLASHSVEMVKYTDHENIMEVKGSNARYLTKEEQKVGVLAGLGTEYSPQINNLQMHKRMIIAENKSDIDLLKTWCTALELEWPNNLVTWPFANSHKERMHLVTQLKDVIDSNQNRLQALSLNDRDNLSYENTNSNLNQSGYNDIIQELGEGNSYTLLRYRIWRRRYIENYLISIPTISRLTEQPEDIIVQYLNTNFGLTYSNAEFIQSDETPVSRNLFSYPAKEILAGLKSTYNISKYDIANEMQANDICEDVRTLIDEIIQMCS